MSDGRGTVVCDLDGVVYLGQTGVAGAGEALSSLEGAGFRILFVTNNSSRRAVDIAERISRLSGFAARSDQVLHSGHAAALLLREEAPRCLVVGGDGIHEALAAAAIAEVERWQEAEAVLVGLDQALTYARLRDAVLAVNAGARLVATNLDATYPVADGRWPGAGAIVAAIETATGVSPVSAGKPAQPMRDLIRARLGSGPEWVVGDRPETDLVMGKTEGWQTVLVLSGVVEDEGDVPSQMAPDQVIGTLADLPAVIGL